MRHHRTTSRSTNSTLVWVVVLTALAGVALLGYLAWSKQRYIDRREAEANKPSDEEEIGIGFLNFLMPGAGDSLR